MVYYVVVREPTILIMYHAHNTFQFEILCSQLLVELYQLVQCKLKNSKPFNSISEKMIIISIIFIKFHNDSYNIRIKTSQY